MLSTWIASIWLLCMSVPDIRSRNVPTWLIGAGGALTLVVSIVENLSGVEGNGGWWSYIGNMFCGMIPGACLLLLAAATKTVGSGDGAVLTLLGAAAGFRKSMMVFGAGLFCAALGSAVLLVIKKVNRNTCLPFLPFLAIGWLLVGMK